MSAEEVRLAVAQWNRGWEEVRLLSAEGQQSINRRGGGPFYDYCCLACVGS